MVDEPSFDVFLSHHSADKPAVELLARRLEDEVGLRPFLDKWHLVPGEPWQEELEEALKHSRTCAVFIGPSGIGPWHNEEMRSALQIKVGQPGFRVIPVLLPRATKPKPDDLPLFLSRLTWVDFRRGLDDADAFHRLVAGIRGLAPGRDVSTSTRQGEQPQKQDVRHFLEDEEGLLEVKSAWVNQLFAMQSADGGFKTNLCDPSSPTQVWATAQSLLGILSSHESIDPSKIMHAFDFIETSRRKDQNEGWGLWSDSFWTVTEIACWVIVASIESMKTGEIWNSRELDSVMHRIERDLTHIVSRQNNMGGWSPIQESRPSFTRTYSTVMALWSLIEAKREPILAQRIGTKYDSCIHDGVLWLLQQYDRRLGWVPNPHRKPQGERFPGLTAQTLFVLSLIAMEKEFSFLRSLPAYRHSQTDFLQNVEMLERPISENEGIHPVDQHFRPTAFQLEGSTFLWAPWSLVLCKQMLEDVILSQRERDSAVKILTNIVSRHDETDRFIETEETFVLAENLFCLSRSLYE